MDDIAICGPRFSFLLSLHLGVELLDHVVILCLEFWGTARLFPTGLLHHLFYALSLREASPGPDQSEN